MIKQFAFLAAKQFGIDPNRDTTKKALPDREVLFCKEFAQKDIKGDTEKLKGEVVSVDTSEKKFTMRVGKKTDNKEVEVRTNGNTTFIKGKAQSTFDAVVREDGKLDVEVTNGVAVSVAGKA